MKRGGFSEDDIWFLNQLVKTLEESESKLEEYYNKEDHGNFNNVKNFMLIVLKKISEVIK